MMRRLSIIPLALLLSACGHIPSEPQVRVVTEKVPVSMPCAPATIGGQPTYIDSDDALKQAPDAAARYDLLIQGRQQRIARLSVLEPVVQGCKE